MPEVLTAIGALTVLTIFFRTVESKWPQSYMSVEDVLSFRISTSASRYALFRFAPVFVVAFFTSAVLSRAGREAGWSILVLGLAHIAVTSGRDLLWTLSQEGRLNSRTMRLITDLSVIAAISVALLVGWLLGKRPETFDLVPNLETLATTFWTALFAAIGGAFLVKATGTQQPSTSDLLNESLKSLPLELVEFAEQQAEEHGRDPYLVKALMLAENLQRPRWVRRLERIKGRIVPRGSYGVMQVQAEQPIDDRESIRRAVRGQLPAGDLWVSGEGPDEERLGTILFNYNPDLGLIQLAERFYSTLTMHKWAEEDFDDDGDDDDV